MNDPFSETNAQEFKQLIDDAGITEFGRELIDWSMFRTIRRALVNLKRSVFEVCLTLGEYSRDKEAARKAAEKIITIIRASVEKDIAEAFASVTDSAARKELIEHCGYNQFHIMNRMYNMVIEGIPIEEAQLTLLRDYRDNPCACKTINHASMIVSAMTGQAAPEDYHE